MPQEILLILNHIAGLRGSLWRLVLAVGSAHLGWDPAFVTSTYVCLWRSPTSLCLQVIIPTPRSAVKIVSECGHLLHEGGRPVNLSPPVSVLPAWRLAHSRCSARASCHADHWPPPPLSFGPAWHHHRWISGMPAGSLVWQTCWRGKQAEGSKVLLESLLGESQCPAGHLFPPVSQHLGEPSSHHPSPWPRLWEADTVTS